MDVLKTTSAKYLGQCPLLSAGSAFTVVLELCRCKRWPILCHETRLLLLCRESLEPSPEVRLEHLLPENAPTGSQ